jgi:hypothetical protein
MAIKGRCDPRSEIHMDLESADCGPLAPGRSSWTSSANRGAGAILLSHVAKFIRRFRLSRDEGNGHAESIRRFKELDNDISTFK